MLVSTLELRFGTGRFYFVQHLQVKLLPVDSVVCLSVVVWTKSDDIGHGILTSTRQSKNVVCLDIVVSIDFTEGRRVAIFAFAAGPLNNTVADFLVPDVERMGGCFGARRRLARWQIVFGREELPQ